MPPISRKTDFKALTDCCFIFTAFLVLVFSIFTAISIIAYLSIDISDYSSDPYVSSTVIWLFVLEAISIFSFVCMFLFLNISSSGKKADKSGERFFIIGAVSLLADIVPMIFYFKNYRSITTDLKAISRLLNAAAVFWYYSIWVAFVSSILIILCIVGFALFMYFG